MSSEDLIKMRFKKVKSPDLNLEKLFTLDTKQIRSKEESSKRYIVASDLRDLGIRDAELYFVYTWHYDFPFEDSKFYVDPLAVGINKHTYTHHGMNNYAKDFPDKADRAYIHFAKPTLNIQSADVEYKIIFINHLKNFSSSEVKQTASYTY